MPNAEHTPTEPDLADRIAEFFAEADEKEAAHLAELTAKYGITRRSDDDRGLAR